MFESYLYNIPTSMYEACPGRRLIVRSRNPSEIVESLRGKDLSALSHAQILTVCADLKPLLLWGHGIPLDLVVEDPQTDLPLLYQCSPLLAKHPVRITVPVVPGFSKAVKLAVSLSFPVKLVPAQPDGPLIEEMSRGWHADLHQPMVSRPIEPFHSIFAGFYREEPLTIWTIQEEDPARDRYITDDGKETLSPRFAGAGIEGQDISLFPEAFKRRLAAAGAECSECEFMESCAGYFKWPDAGYRCDGVKTLLKTMKDAAKELKEDVEAFESCRGEGRQ